MPDISMCEGTDGVRICPRKDQCYRHTAKPTPRRQSYMALPLKEDNSCDYFWPVHKQGEARVDK